MQVFYIRKRAIISGLIVITSILILWYLVKYFKNDTLGVLLNNDRELPIYCVETPDRRIALTFDAAWGDGCMQDILDVLKRYDAKATFFITGIWAEKHPEIVQDMVMDGHEVGNHSQTHSRMSGISKKAVISEIRDAQSSIERITGKKTNLFRAPFGDYSSTMIAAAADMDYKIIQWDVDSLDWRGMDEEMIYGRVISKVSNGSIVLFHNNMKDTVEALPKIIEDLRKGGYRFVTVSELLIRENCYIDSMGVQRSLK